MLVIGFFADYEGVEEDEYEDFLEVASDFRTKEDVYFAVGESTRIALHIASNLPPRSHNSLLFLTSCLSSLSHPITHPLPRCSERQEDVRVVQTEQDHRPHPLRDDGGGGGGQTHHQPQRTVWRIGYVHNTDT